MTSPCRPANHIAVFCCNATFSLSTNHLAVFCCNAAFTQATNQIHFLSCISFKREYSLIFCSVPKLFSISNSSISSIINLLSNYINQTSIIGELGRGEDSTLKLSTQTRDYRPKKGGRFTTCSRCLEIKLREAVKGCS